MTESPAPVKKSLSQEFFDFLMIFGIIGLAIAFVIGQAASKLVTAFVNDIITPFIGLFLPAGDLNAVKFTVGNSTFHGRRSNWKYYQLSNNCIHSICCVQAVI